MINHSIIFIEINNIVNPYFDKTKKINPVINMAFSNESHTNGSFLCDLKYIAVKFIIDCAI